MRRNTSVTPERALTQDEPARSSAGWNLISWSISIWSFWADFPVRSSLGSNSHCTFRYIPWLRRHDKTADLAQKKCSEREPDGLSDHPESRWLVEKKTVKEKWWNEGRCKAINWAGFWIELRKGELGSWYPDHIHPGKVWMTHGAKKKEAQTTTCPRLTGGGLWQGFADYFASQPQWHFLGTLWGVI